MRQWQDFKYIRWGRAINLALMCILSFTFVFGINYLASRHFVRKDITHTRTYSLTPETQAYIQRLNKPVHIIVAYGMDLDDASSADLLDDIKQIVKEFEYASKRFSKHAITSEYVNIYKQRKRAQELVSLYGLKYENAIIIASGDTHREILPADLYHLERGSIKSFVGERVFMSSILDIMDEKVQKVYFTQGHGEYSLNDVRSLSGISELKHLLESQNNTTQTFSLIEEGHVPEDADLLVIAAPQLPFIAYEVDKIRQYIRDKNGKVLIFVGPKRDHGLEALLQEWGIISDDRVIIDIGADYQQSGGDFLLKNFSQHPITDNLMQYELGVVVGLMRPVREGTDALKKSIQVTPLVFSSPTSWAKALGKDMQSLQYNPELDLPGPLSVAVASQRKIDANIGLNIHAGKLVVIGNTDMIINRRINTLANRMFVMNTINWLLNKDRLLNIPERAIQKYQIVISKNSIYYIGFKMLIIPVALAFIGAFVYFVRYKT